MYVLTFLDFNTVRDDSGPQLAPAAPDWFVFKVVGAPAVSPTFRMQFKSALDPITTSILLQRYQPGGTWKTVATDADFAPMRLNLTLSLVETEEPPSNEDLLPPVTSSCSLRGGTVKTQCTTPTGECKKPPPYTDEQGRLVSRAEDECVIPEAKLSKLKQDCKNKMTNGQTPQWNYRSKECVAKPYKKELLAANKAAIQAFGKATAQTAWLTPVDWFPMVLSTSTPDAPWTTQTVVVCKSSSQGMPAFVTLRIEDTDKTKPKIKDLRTGIWFGKDYTPQITLDLPFTSIPSLDPAAIDAAAAAGKSYAIPGGATLNPAAVKVLATMTVPDPAKHQLKIASPKAAHDNIMKVLKDIEKTGKYKGRAVKKEELMGFVQTTEPLYQNEKYFVKPSDGSAAFSTQQTTAMNLAARAAYKKWFGGGDSFLST